MKREKTTVKVLQKTKCDPAFHGQDCDGAPKFPISISSRSENICADLCKVKRSSGWVLTSAPSVRSSKQNRNSNPAAAQQSFLPSGQAPLLKTSRAWPSVSESSLLLLQNCPPASLCKPLTPTCHFSARNTLVRIAKLACNEILKIRKKFIPLEKKRHSGSSLAAPSDTSRESETKRCRPQVRIHTYLFKSAWRRRSES